MITLENLLIYVPLACILVIMPGPDFALITRVSLVQGRRCGQAAACGVALGILLHTSAAMLGISAIISQSVTLFNLLKLAGAAYLIWMGVHVLREGRQISRAVGISTQASALAADQAKGQADSALLAATPLSFWPSFKQGFLTNALNPKAVVAFLTFLPQFMNPHEALAPQFLELGGIMAFLCLFWFGSLAYIFSHVRKAFENPRFQAWLHCITGLFFIAFGLKLATSDL